MKAADFLNGLMNPPVGTATPTDPAPSLGTATRADGEPERADVHADADIAVHPTDEWLETEDLGQWTYADGRLSGADANDGEELEPGERCPVCGSLDVLVGLWGERCCQRCNADKLSRSRRLAERAERLRQRARTESRPPDAHGNERLRSGPRIDTCLNRTQ